MIGQILKQHFLSWLGNLGLLVCELRSDYLQPTEYSVATTFVHELANCCSLLGKLACRLFPSEDDFTWCQEHWYKLDKWASFS